MNMLIVNDRYMAMAGIWHDMSLGLTLYHHIIMNTNYMMMTTMIDRGALIRIIVDPMK